MKFSGRYHMRLLAAGGLILAAGLPCLKAQVPTNAASSIEASIRGGAYANLDFDEVGTNYLHIKYSAGLDTSRKTYLQFDLAGVNVDPLLPAEFAVEFASTNVQRVKLWGLKQAYPSFSSAITWNTAQANHTNSNDLLTSGTYFAAQIGSDVLIPVSNAPTHTFTIPRLGDFLFGSRVTLILTGANDANNNAGGLRLRRSKAVLRVNLPRLAAAHYDVYLFAGQSNADGRGAVADLVGGMGSWAFPQSDVLIYYANPINSNPLNPSYQTSWEWLAPGFSVAPGYSGTLPSPTFGPEVSCGRALADAYPRRRLALLKVTKGGTSLSADWDPATGYMYATLTNVSRIALQTLVNQGASYTLRGLFWHQGESDSGLTTAAYQARLTAFIQAARQDFAVTNLPFVIGELATNRSIATRQAQLNVAQLVPHVGFASSSNLPTLQPDDPHFTSSSVITLGQRMAAALEIPATRVWSITRSGSNLLVQAAGLARAACVLHASTNLMHPRAAWAPVATNQFSSTGQIFFTVPWSTGPGPVYYFAADE